MDINNKNQLFVGFVIVAIVGGVIVAVFSSPTPYIMLAQTFLFVVFMYVMFYTAPSIFNKIKTWTKTPKIRNLGLEKKYLQDGVLAIVLSNREYRKPAIWIHKLQIADNPLTWFPISMAGFPVKSGSSKEIFHIKWDKQHRYFVTADFQNDDYGKVFGYGVYKFDIVITYGFSKNENDKIKRFSVVVSLEENNVIRVLEIRHSDSSAGNANR